MVTLEEGTNWEGSPGSLMRGWKYSISWLGGDSMGVHLRKNVLHYTCKIRALYNSLFNGGRRRETGQSKEVGRWRCEGGGRCTCTGTSRLSEDTLHIGSDSCTVWVWADKCLTGVLMRRGWEDRDGFCKGISYKTWKLSVGLGDIQRRAGVLRRSRGPELRSVPETLLCPVDSHPHTH